MPPANERNNPRENLIRELVIYNLRQTIIFQESHGLLVVANNQIVSINYWTEASQTIPDQTALNLQIQKGICYILILDIKESERRQGHGRDLYHATERIAKELNCNRIITTPSGEGIPFYQKMGFLPLENWEAYKDLR